MTSAAVAPASTTQHTARVPWQAKFLALAVIWGSSFLLMKVGLSGLHPLQIAALRILSGAAIVAALLFAGGGRLPRGGRTWAHLLVCGFFLGAFPFAMFAMSETRVASALAGIGNATTPIATVLATLAILPGARADRRKLLGVLIGFVGVVTIMQPWELHAAPDLLGFGMALAGGMSYGIGWTYNRRFLAGVDLGGLSQPAATLLSATVLIVPALLIWAALQPGGISAAWSYDGAGEYGAWLPLAAVLALGVIGTGLAYVLQFDVVRAAGPVVGSTLTYLIPVVSVLLGVLVLGEQLTWATILGFVIVLGAALVINAPTRSRRGAGRSA